MVSWACLAMSLMGFFITRAVFRQRMDLAVYLGCFGLGLIWFFAMPAKNDRIWHDEVAKIIQFERQGDVITLHNVRNFRWYDTDKYEIYWETCEYRPSELDSFDIISGWGLKKVVHTMASFGFKDGSKLSFSIEIRKESHQSFSAIDGFFVNLSWGWWRAMKRI